MKWFFIIVFILFALMVIGWKSLLFWCALGLLLGVILVAAVRMAEKKKMIRSKIEQ